MGDDFVSACKDGHLIVITLKHTRKDFSSQNGLLIIGFLYFEVFGADDDVNGLIAFEALVNALKNGVAELNFEVLNHSA